MRHGRYVYVLGDVHGNFGKLNDFIHRHIRRDRVLASIATTWKRDGDDLQAMILQCGDFAWFWPLQGKSVIQNRVDFLPGGTVPIYWIGGNHEDWDELDALGRGISEVARGVFFCPFGTTLTLSPDVTVLFAGGAESFDRDWRLSEMRRGAPKIWWEQEGVSEEDLARLAFVPRADWVISHTAPDIFDVDSQMRKVEGYDAGFDEPSRGMLDAVFRKYQPTRWFFGHFHHHMDGEADGCKWECLSTLGMGNAWTRVFLEWRD